MKLELYKDVQAHTLLEGFPGFGLVGTIVTEYLLEHLDCELVGEITGDNLPPTVAIHQGNLVRPIGVYYNEKYNLLLIHAILDVRGVESELADTVHELIQKANIQDAVSIEGVMTAGGEGLFCFNNQKFAELGCEPVTESVIMGVTASLLLKYDQLGCIFAQTHANLPDSRAAAGVIEFLDKYLGLEVETQPLLEKAEQFEEKLKTMMSQQNKTVSDADKKQMSYMG